MKNKMPVLVIFAIIFSIPPFIWKNEPFLSYTLMDIVTGLCVTYGIYYYSEINDEKNHKVNKIDQVIDVFRTRLITLFSTPIDVENNKAQYYHTFKYLDMSKSFNCNDETKVISENLEKIETYITDNIYEKNEYFIKNSARKEKIPNLIDNIETQLDNITKKIFSFDRNK